jgi:hypothetical protein
MPACRGRCPLFRRMSSRGSPLAQLPRTTGGNCSTGLCGMASQNR